MTTNDTTAPMTTTTATLTDGFPATSAQATPPRVECLASTDAAAINAAMAATWGREGARVVMASEGRVRFLNVFGDCDMERAAFHFVTGYLAAKRNE